MFDAPNCIIPFVPSLIVKESVTVVPVTFIPVSSIRTRCEGAVDILALVLSVIYGLKLEPSLTTFTEPPAPEVFATSNVIPTPSVVLPAEFVNFNNEFVVEPVSLRASKPSLVTVPVTSMPELVVAILGEPLLYKVTAPPLMACK